MMLGLEGNSTLLSKESFELMLNQGFQQLTYPTTLA